MNEIIIKQIALELGVSKDKVLVVLNLLEEGNTVPFIARYRKEATGAMDEEMIRQINEVYEYQVNLLKRKEDVIRLIEEKGMLTDDIKKSVLACSKLVEVEDIYRPYKEKKKTKATEAIALGLEPLAKMIMAFPTTGDLESISMKFINDKVKSSSDALMHASFIISEWISDNASYRKYIRSFIFREGSVVSKIKKNAIDEKKTYEIYYAFSEVVKFIKPHRVMAINRGEKEGILSVGLDYDKEVIVSYLESKIIKNKDSFVTDLVRCAIVDSLKRLILPSVEREVRSELKEVASDVSIDNFAENVERLLLTPPMKEKIVLGLDPAFRTGCKLAVLDKTGKPLEISVIYPTEPRNDIVGSKAEVLKLIDKYNVYIIAIGNGTASRESEAFIAGVIKEVKRKVEYIIVNEAGASVYSASNIAIEEFPELTVEKRSAISIGRRLQDPLAELVKIDPKSIGVGLYQHDVIPKKLDESLDFVVTKTVNSVGVNINTASSSLLSYVSGLSKKSIKEIIDIRNKLGKFNNREEVKKLKSFTPKVYEQAIGFIRIIDGDNKLDKTSIHPESYDATKSLLKELGFTVEDIGTSKLVDSLGIDIDKYSTKLGIDKYTLEDIILSLKSPERDPREAMDKPILKSDILKIDDLKNGMKLQGTVRNVVDFGLFIDIGLKNDGLAHISKLTTKFLKHPSEMFGVGDILDCYVDNIDLEKNKVGLRLID